MELTALKCLVLLGPALTMQREESSSLRLLEVGSEPVLSKTLKGYHWATSLDHTFCKTPSILSDSKAVDFDFALNFEPTSSSREAMGLLTDLFPLVRQGVMISIQGIEDPQNLLGTCISEFSRGVSLWTGDVTEGFILCVYTEEYLKATWPRSPKQQKA